MSEFFVVRGARRQGLGRAAAAELFALYPGRWEIPFQEENAAAARFWRRVAAEVGESVSEERRPVPGKPHIPPDVWLILTVA
jgi:predicted acetyltransferase